MAAGLGYIEFATGDILTAANANGYLASQTVMVFASAAARTSAIVSPQEGMMSYLKDTDAVEKYNGSSWVAVGASSSYTSLASGTLSSAALNITSIAGTYKALILELRDITKSSAFDVNLQFNTDTASNYGNTTSRTVNSVSSVVGSSNTTGIVLNGAGFKASTQSNQIIVKIDGYAQTDMWKILSAYGSGVDTSTSATEVFLTAGTWRNTAAITSIQTDSTLSMKYTLWGIN